MPHLVSKKTVNSSAVYIVTSMFERKRDLEALRKQQLRRKYLGPRKFRATDERNNRRCMLGA
jgi:hypothetical protein